jgi:hypothetical protein
MSQQQQQQIVNKLRAGGLDHVVIERIVETLLDDTTNFMAILGSVQSGKTGAMIVACVTAIFAGYTPLVILRNATCDGVQFIERIVEDMENLSEKLKGAGYEEEDILAHMVKTQDEFTYPMVYCSLGNSTQLKHFIDKIYNCPSFPKKKLIIFADEGDDIYYNNEQNSKQVQDNISFLREECFKFIPVTATCDVILHAEKRARFADIVTLPTQANYKGINEVFFSTEDALSPKKKKPAKSAAIKRIVADIVSRHQPRDFTKLILVNVFSMKKDQHECVTDKHVQLSRTVDGVEYKTVYASMNCDGFLFQMDFDISWKMERSNKGFKAKFHRTKLLNGRYTFKVGKGEELKHVLDVLYFDRFSGIKIEAVVLFCAQMASRGLSFTSSRPKPEAINQEVLHITDMICSDKEDLATAYQSARIFGNFDDNRRLTIYSPKEFEVGLRTIIDNNDQKYDTINNVDGVVRMPTELICNHINSFEYISTVRTDSGDAVLVSEKSFCSKIKGDIRLKTMATTANRRKGNHVKGDNETLQEAVDRVYGPGETLVETTKHFKIDDGLTTLNTDATRDYCKLLRKNTKSFVKNRSRPVNMGMRIVTEATKSVMFRAPWKMCTSHKTGIYRYNLDIIVRIISINDLAYENRVYSWHSHDGTVNFGKDPTVEAIDVIEEAVVNVASGVIEVF